MSYRYGDEAVCPSYRRNDASYLTLITPPPPPNTHTFDNALQAPSKRAVTWYILRITIEDGGLSSFALGPGYVHTTLNDAETQSFIVDQPTQAKLIVDLNKSYNKITKVPAETSNVEHGG